MGPPGNILRELLRARGLSQAEFADMIGRPHQMVSEIIGAKKRITGRTALDLEKAFGVGAEYWMYAQAAYDLSIARERYEAGTVVHGRATR